MLVCFIVHPQLTEICTYSIVQRVQIAGVGLCKIKQAEQNNTNKHGAGLPLDVIAEFKPIYTRLLEDSLLRGCLDCKTQNQNEAPDGMFWERVPQGVFVVSEIFQLGIYDAVTNLTLDAKLL